MGFSIGGFLGSLAGSVASSLPIIGPVIGAVASGFGAVPGAAAPPVRQISFIPPPRPGGSSVGPTAASAMMLPAVVRGARGLVAGLLTRASAAIGKRVTRASVLSLVREVGITAAATALALTAVEVAQIIASRPTRRRRGITASQIATTKATMRRLDSLNRAIAGACPPPRRRRAPSRAAVHHAK